IILLHENTSEELDELLQRVSVPVLLASVNVAGSPLPCVGIDDAKAAYDAVSYLIRIGHERIAGVFGKSYTLGQLRKNGYLQAMADAGLPVGGDSVIYSDCSIDGGVKAAQKFTQNKSIPTAVFCVSDEIAIGVMDYLDKLGYRVPEDVSVFGVDDIYLAGIFRPRLSTVNQPVDEIGVQAARMLVELIKNPEADPRLVLEHSLTLRDSCAPVSRS
ncbi:MAG TPA: substrate-binding domain-containing protein, partial [Feifaniaceae bacterium]|nr:substrate-binding domain-containing protein [Feifaniaceae bacterium]